MAFSEPAGLDFGLTWDAVLGVLTAEASDETTALHALGLRPESVAAGELGRAMPMHPPFVYAFLIPSAGPVGMRAPDGVPHAPAAALRVFCGVAPEKTSREAVGRAVALGAAVLDTLRRRLPHAGVLARYEASPLRLDSYTAKLAVCEIAGTVFYDLTPLAPRSVDVGEDVGGGGTATPTPTPTPRG